MNAKNDSQLVYKRDAKKYLEIYSNQNCVFCFNATQAFYNTISLLAIKFNRIIIFLFRVSIYQQDLFSNGVHNFQLSNIHHSIQKNFSKLQ